MSIVDFTRDPRTLQWTGLSTNWCIMVEMAGSNTNGTRKRKAKTDTMAIVPDLEMIKTKLEK